MSPALLAVSLERANTLQSQRTKLLIALLVAASLAAGMSYSWQDKQRSAAALAAHDLGACRANIADLVRWNSVSASGSTPAASSPDLTIRLHTAATEAGMPDQIASIDHGQQRQLPDMDYAETLVLLRLNAVTIRQLVTFLHQLSEHDASVRAKSVGLGLPAGQGADSVGDTWAADVTLSCLTYAPRTRANAP
jgi:hypothetical protein